MPTVEVRCPLGPKRLLLKLMVSGESPRHSSDGSLIELACDDCKRELRKQGQQVVRVLHRYDLNGELVETLQV